MQTNKPIVYLVGAGPGDPGLLTVKGLECIKRADVIIYDFLASPTLLKNASEHAEVIYVGKKGGDHTLPQEKINSLIVEKAVQGKTVVRLKGGDPFIFGRGGEEAEILAKEGIPFEIVPGVTSAIAAPAYAGIPLTHRDYTSVLTFVTGHEDPTKKDSSINWESLAKSNGTIVCLMGVKNLPEIVQRLKENGLSSTTPAAVVRWGTTSRQRTVTGTLDTIAHQVKAAKITAPAIIIVGRVVQLRDTLKWFENRPLMGKRIVVTRSREQASDLVQRLTELGAECIECPTIRVVPPDSWEPLDQAIQKLHEYQWVIFTSVNGVHYFFQRLFHLGKDCRSLGNIKTAAIGPATSQKLFQFGLKTDILPKTYQAESVIEAFQHEIIKGQTILLPRAKEARSILPDELSKMGAIVHDIQAYKTIQDLDAAPMLLEELENNPIDMITFTSSSTVKNFNALLPEEPQRSRLMKNIIVASIGPITTQTAKDLGFDVHLTAETFTIPGLCDAIVRYYSN